MPTDDVATPSTTPSSLAHPSVSSPASHLTEKISGTPRTPGSLSLWIYLFSFVLVAALVIGLATFTLYQERDRYRERAIQATRNISTLLAQHTSDVFEAVELQVRTTVAYAEDQLARDGLDPTRLNRFLAHQGSLIPELRGFRMTDAAGRVRYGVGADAALDVSVADETFFKAAVATEPGRAVVMGPVFAPIAGKWVIVFAHRVNGPDGRLAGVVYANFLTESFQTVFSRVQLGPQGAATIRGTDMALVHRVPTTRNAVGSRNVSKELSEIIARSPEGGQYVAATALDGIERSNAYVRLKDYPFYVIVGLATTDYLGGWMSSLVLVLGLTGIALMAAGVAAVSAWRSQRRLMRDLTEKTRLASELSDASREMSLVNAELEVQIRKAQAAVVARDAFLAHVSHELRTPLHQISGLAELIGRQGLSDKQSDWLARLRASGRHLTDMVDRMLELVRLESDQAAFNRTPVNVAAMLRTLQQQWQPRLQEKGLTFECQTPPADLAVLGDSQRLSAAISCYLSNALAHTRSGGVTLACDIVRLAASDVQLRFSVADTGPGIPEQTRARLFDPFVLSDNSSTTSQNGLGLGLAIVRKTAELMGGQAGCISQPDAGTIFWMTVTLPRLQGLSANQAAMA